MPRDGFYNDNEYREYPFVFRPTYDNAILPPAAIVDCGFILGLDSQYDAANHAVYLGAIERANDQFIFVFNTSAPGAANYQLVFTTADTTKEWTKIYSLSSISTAGFCQTEPAWEGFVVFGDLEDLRNTVQPGEILQFGVERQVEPGRIQSLVKSHLRSINVGNFSRLIALPENCEDPLAAHTQNDRSIVVNARCLNDEIAFKAGFNCRITQNNATNTINIAAVKDANTSGPAAAEFCANGSEIKLSADEQPIAGSKFLSGGPACDEIVTAINGLTGPNITIVGGGGIQIVGSDTPNTLVIKLNDQLLSAQC